MTLANPSDVSSAVNKITDFVLIYVTALAAVGALTMALIEGFKNVFRTRDNYQRVTLQKWIASYKPSDELFGESLSLKKKVRAAGSNSFNDYRDRYETFADWVYYEVMHLTTGTTADHIVRNGIHVQMDRNRTADRALFSLELEKMMGQIQDAADVAMSSPQLYPYLYYFLTSGTDEGDIRTWFNEAQRAQPIAPPVNAADPQSFRNATALKQQSKEIADTYSRLTKFMRHKLDAFQLVTGYTWRERNQWAAIAVGAILLFTVLVWLQWTQIAALANAGSSDEVAWQLIADAAASVIGGILAPIAKDLMVALQKVRSGG